MDNLYSVAQIRMVEAAAGAPLMQRAGKEAANFALALLGKNASLPVLVLAGPGNNGGDALEVAANLDHAGVDVWVLHLPGAAPSPETAHALARAQASDARFIDALPGQQRWALVLDGLFGIGLARPLAGMARTLAEASAHFGCPVLALDVPSGLDADSGAVVGPDGVAVHATHTITFIGDKPGLHTCQGRDHAGTVTVARLGIDPALYPPPEARHNGPALFGPQLRPRAHASHKGSHGDVAIIGGARGMAGAPVLAARAALFAGAGRVLVGALDPATSYDSLHPEIMLREAGQIDCAVQVLGPGMGDSAAAIKVLGKAIGGSAALVLDADALNLLAASPDLQRRLAARAAPALLTPHPLEAARLLGVTAPVIQADRLAAARELAARFAAVVVLKGSGSVIAAPGGALVINGSGNPGLATAGTGDVLAGVCGALLAQGWPLWEAALGAVWLHGSAADRLVAQGAGPIGLSAGELAPAIRSLRNELARPAA